MGQCRPRLRPLLEDLYRRYNDRRYALQDPVRYIYACNTQADREVVGLVVALLAYGRLKQILRACDEATRRLGPSPAELLLGSTSTQLRSTTDGFCHRRVDAERFASVLEGLRAVLGSHGSLEACFGAHDDRRDDTVLSGLIGLSAELVEAAGPLQHVVPCPRRGSACKRWHLFLRWMARSDEVDPGVWQSVSPARLIVPLDTHLWRLCRGLGLTRRRTCNLATALEVTRGFRRIHGADPVRYDFCLMHASVAGDPALGRLLAHADATLEGDCSACA
jgi:uncharacterized protein (TIGR02757 family)